uniref:Uncharacterized protein n=1 Tax=Chrysotila carterae TaxID=13221 RepID=A0A7S4BAN2_CHRCT|mmetsp:Transcript_50332/g.109089  ORF Transcript_50332/g.109089 Transcript_50332/m.109089 type:complete len:263 (+) Transcript_50332:752-1540(+)|eukprot:6213542-Pleurochrysis_carterae.AAC.6
MKANSTKCPLSFAAAGPGLCLFGKELGGHTLTFTRTASFQGTTHLATRAYYDDVVIPQLLSNIPQANEQAMRKICKVNMTTLEDFVRWGGSFLLGSVGQEPMIQVAEHNESLHLEPFHQGFAAVMVMMHITSTCESPGPMPGSAAVAYSASLAEKYLALQQALEREIREVIDDKKLRKVMRNKLYGLSHDLRLYLNTTSMEVFKATNMAELYCNTVCGGRYGLKDFAKLVPCQQALMNGVRFTNTETCQCICSKELFIRRHA